ncbi:hypothetical protein DFJ74DRAFT_672441 [Hyaloraphidium curvatum]|nr:hypothetical protein DFJ74DRAFT_672441 [Hyaloraphidium curvatum]
MSGLADATLTLSVAGLVTVATGVAIATSFRWLLADHNLATVSRALRAAAAAQHSALAGVEAACGALLFPEIRTLRGVLLLCLLRARRAGPAALALLENASGPPNLQPGPGNSTSGNLSTGAANSSSASLGSSGSGLTLGIPGAGSAAGTPPGSPVKTSAPPSPLSASVSFLSWPTTAVDAARSRRETASPTREAARRAGLGRAKAARPRQPRAHRAKGSSSGLLQLADSASQTSLADGDDDTHSVAESADDVADTPAASPPPPSATTLRAVRITLTPPADPPPDHAGRRPRLPQITTATMERHLRSLEDRLTRMLEKVDGVRASEEALRDAVLQSVPSKPHSTHPPAQPPRAHTADLELASHPKITAEIAQAVDALRVRKSALTRTIHRGLDTVDALLELACGAAAEKVAVPVPPGREKLGECFAIGAAVEIPPELFEDPDGEGGEDAAGQTYRAAVDALVERLPEVGKDMFADLQAAHEAALRKPATPPPSGVEAGGKDEGEKPAENGHAAGHAAAEAAPDIWKLAANPAQAWTLVTGFATDVAGRAKQAWQGRT